MDVICQDCGEANPQGATFCRSCRAFLTWDGTSLIKAVHDGGTAPPPVASPDPAVPPTDHGSPVGAPGSPAPEATAPGVAPAPGARPAEPPSATATATATATAAVPSGMKGCPDCGQANPLGVRFCTRCGYCFVRLKNSTALTPAQLAAADRAARQAYRRSLPPFYRWRRVGIAAAVAIALILGAVVTGGRPVRFALDGWHWLNRQYVSVAPLAVHVDPSAPFANSDPANLIDGTANEFTMNWSPQGAVACGPAPGTSWITLTLSPTRVRRVLVYPGLDKLNPRRPQQPIPRTIAISFEDAECKAFELSAEPWPNVIEVDSGVEVTRVHIGINQSFAAAADAEKAISITEVILKKYPD